MDEHRATPGISPGPTGQINNLRLGMPKPHPRPQRRQKAPLPQKRNRPVALRRKNQNSRRVRSSCIQPHQAQNKMSEPIHISGILLQIAANLNDPMGRTLRQCPFIQAELIRRKKISLDDLTDEQIDRIIEWDQQNTLQK